MPIEKCKLCGSPIRVIYREDGSSDHYEPVPNREMHNIPNPIPPALQDYLRIKRRGKRTLAITGAAWTTGPWAPFDDPEVDIWAENELHGVSWCKEERINKWFQLHPKWCFEREHPYNHREWMEMEHPFDIYTQQKFDSVPNSTPFPLREVQGLIRLEHGETTYSKIFTSTFCYQLSLALLDDRYQRIECYGIEMTMEGEYGYQREAFAYWLGKADGMGKEIWIPEQCSLFISPLYGYEQIRKGDTGEMVTEETCQIGFL